jgi:tRNA threonylcarbamoyladenosine biosynthesis protein TsaB
VNILFLDLASHSGLIACVDDRSVVAQTLIDHRIDDAQLVVLVEKTLADAGWAYPDLTQLACVVGPGGFTSLRVGVAAINALSYALQIPACGIHVSDLYAARGSTKDFIWLHSTKKQELFVRGFGEMAKKFPEAVCMKLDDLVADLPEGVTWTGELIPEHRERFMKRLAVELEGAPLSSILPDFLAKQSYTRETLIPWYGRGW